MSPEQNSPFMYIGRRPAALLCDRGVLPNCVQHFVLCEQQGGAVLTISGQLSCARERATYLQQHYVLFFSSAGCWLCHFHHPFYWHYPPPVFLWCTFTFWELAGCLARSTCSIAVEAPETDTPEAGKLWCCCSLSLSQLHFFLEATAIKTP